MFYGAIYILTGGDYAVAFFIPNLIIEFFGASSLFKITSTILNHYDIDRKYGFYSVVLFSFNAEIIVGGLWANGLFDLGTSFLPILVYISYLSVFKNRKYYLLLVFASFYLFYSFPGGYPNGAIILFEEFLISLFILLSIYITSIKENKLKKLFSAGKILLLNLASVFIGNIYLVIPTIKIIPLYLVISSDPGKYFAFGVGWDSVDYIQNTVRLLNTWVINSGNLIPSWESAYLSNSLVMSLLYLPFALAVISIVFLRKRSHISLYILFWIVLFLSKANHYPFGIIFVWLVNHVILFAPFYTGASFYPLQIMFYGIFGSISTYHIISLLSNQLSKKKKNPKPHHDSIKENENKNKRHLDLTKLVSATLIFALLIGSSYPIVVGDLSIGTLQQPAGIQVPQQYLKLNSLISNSDSPTIVFPGTNDFNLNSYGNISWYGGGNIYPNLLSSPSRSSMYPTLGQAIPGSIPYNVLTYLYSLPNTFPQNYSKNVLSQENYSTSVVITNGVSVVPFNNTRSELFVKYNYSQFSEPSGAWVAQEFNKPIDISNFSYLVLNISTNNINLSNLEVGFSFSGNANNFVAPGNWYYVGSENGIYNSFTVRNGNSTSVFTQISYPSEQSGNQNLSHVDAIVIRDKSHQTGVGNLNIYSIKFAKQNITRESYIFAKDLNILGFKYVLVDKSIQDTPYPFRIGDYYLDVFNNSEYFKNIYSVNPVSLYVNDLYNGAFSHSNSYIPVSNSNLLLHELYFNSTNNVSQMSFGPDQISGWINSNNSYGNTSIKFERVNSLEYHVVTRSKSSFILVFKESYNPNFIAMTSNGTIITDHFEINGYDNGWIIPSGINNLTIFYKGSNSYFWSEVIEVAIPFIAFLVFATITVSNRNGGKRSVKNKVW